MVRDPHLPRAHRLMRQAEWCTGGPAEQELPRKTQILREAVDRIELSNENYMSIRLLIQTLLKIPPVWMLLVTAFGSSALACPDKTAMGQDYRYSGPELYTPKEFAIIAGGENSLQACGKRLRVLGDNGFFTTPPDFSVYVTQLQNYELHIGVRSECDSALLVNSPDEIWFYDDDSNGNLDALLKLTTVPDGWLDIWVGTYDGEYCNATLRLETF